jgi:hypothetical protein
MKTIPIHSTVTTPDKEVLGLINAVVEAYQKAPANNPPLKVFSVQPIGIPLIEPNSLAELFDSFYKKLVELKGELEITKLLLKILLAKMPLEESDVLKLKEELQEICLSESPSESPKSSLYLPTKNII